MLTSRKVYGRKRCRFLSISKVNCLLQLTKPRGKKKRNTSCDDENEQTDIFISLPEQHFLIIKKEKTSIPRYASEEVIQQKLVLMLVLWKTM